MGYDLVAAMREAKAVTLGMTRNHDYHLTPNGAATAILKTRHRHGTIQEIGIADKPSPTPANDKPPS